MKEGAILPQNKLENNTVVVGAGALGLIVAKKLTDLGQIVTLLETAPTVADGPSIKNHGWLHRGSVHSLSVSDPEKKQAVVNKITYGHEYIKNYARECIEEPLHPIYAVTQDPLLALRAVDTWERLEVAYKEIKPDKFFQKEPDINPDLVQYVFQTADLKINNRMLYQKLLTDIQRNGGKYLNNAQYHHTGEKSIEVNSNGRQYTIDAENFIYCTGANLGESYQGLTDTKLNMVFWKSHLILLPRFTQQSVVSLDRNQAITITHGDYAITNRSYDEKQVDTPDNVVLQEEIDATFDTLSTMYPKVKELRGRAKGIACIKPDIATDVTGRHSVDSHILEPVKGHVFALAGKMTEAPYVADTILHKLYTPAMFPDVSSRPIDIFTKTQQ
ncbi:MAG TPA: FAD-dependent oxidoreductase [Methylomirabilota bacterium]|nr:FAD-dependent oxidoreductase [Methylomirabilota bacterium]